MLFERDFLDQLTLPVRRRVIAPDFFVAACTVFWAKLYRYSRRSECVAVPVNYRVTDKSSVQVIARAATIFARWKRKARVLVSARSLSG